jgi:tetratricopeptide (TPR) repeat protein
MDDKVELLGRACELRDAGKLDAALEVAHRVVSLDPEYPFGWEFLGGLFGQLGQHYEALNSYTQAIRCANSCSAKAQPTKGADCLSPGSPWYSRATEYARVGQRSEAIADLTEAIRRAPGWVKLLSSDENFQVLAGDIELNRLIDDGLVQLRALELSTREEALRRIQLDSEELCDTFGTATSPELVGQLRSLLIGVFGALTASSTAEEAAPVISAAFLKLTELLARYDVDTRETRLVQRTGQELVPVALVFGLHDIFQLQLERGPWFHTSETQQ